MVSPLEMAVLSLSVRPLLDQFLPHLHPTHMTELSSSSVAACVLGSLPQLVTVLILRPGWPFLLVYRRETSALVMVINPSDYIGCVPSGFLSN